MNIKRELTLNNGVKIPLLGFGVWEVPGGRMGVQAMVNALEAGYRHIDTAAFYGNEVAVGQAVKVGGLDRSEVFITTKVWNSDHGYKQTLAAADKSLERLRMDYIDLYLIHWPVLNARLHTWAALEELLATGKARSIGVSNYMVRHLEELSGGIVPAVNQIELNPYNYLSRLEVVDYCRAHGIAVEAYGPLARGLRLDDPRMAAIAGKYRKTTAQVMLRWALQHGFIVIPKSVRREKIYENADIFDFALGAEELAEIDGYNENLVTTWDPTNAP